MLALQAAIRAASGCGFSSSAAIRFGGALPDVVEPRDEDLHLGPPRGLARVERRLGHAALEPVDDRGRVAHHLVAVDDDRYERLAAHRLDGRAVEWVDVDPFELEALVAGGERDAFDVRGVRDPVDARGGDTKKLALEPVLASGTGQLGNRDRDDDSPDE